MSEWGDYWRTVRRRITLDGGAFRIVWVVTWLTLKGWIRQAFRPADLRVGFVPHPGAPWYTLPLALRYTSVKRQRPGKDADIWVRFDDRTVTETAFIKGRANSSGTDSIINGDIDDISKGHVGAVFADISGYPIAVDPTHHDGPMVEKSDENGVHDGRIVMGPLGAPLPGATYQKLVQSLVRDDVSEDLRCTCVDGHIVSVIRKEKRGERRFSTQYMSTAPVSADSVFSKEEQTLITRFCHKMRLDFGSIDVLRDHLGDGRIYIVDVNKTCMPVLALPLRDLEIVLQDIGSAAQSMMRARVKKKVKVKRSGSEHPPHQ